MRWNHLLLLALFAGPAAAQTPPGAPTGAVVKAEAQTQRERCDGGPALIEGNHNTVVLTGQCSGLVLKGLENTVAVELKPGASVRVEGSGNKVSFKASTPPDIATFGPDNSVVPGEIPAEAPKPPPAEPPPPPPPKPPVLPEPNPPPVPHPASAPTPGTGLLRLSGEDQQRIADCTGRPVEITGNRSAYVLRGGCESLSVEGDVDMVQAELRPGVPIRIIGRGTTVSWALLEHGKPPVASVHGTDNRVQRTTMIGGQPVP